MDAISNSLSSDRLTLKHNNQPKLIINKLNRRWANWTFTWDVTSILICQWLRTEATIIFTIWISRDQLWEQELALYTEFTIQETFFYFGRINKMTSSQIREQMEVLGRLLDLPAYTRTVSTLSGGQQRRISLAVSLLHDPELIILDEPTVGLDPLLRPELQRWFWGGLC